MDAETVLNKLKIFLKIDLAESYPNPPVPLNTLFLLRMIEFLERAESYSHSDLEDLYFEIQESIEKNDSTLTNFGDILTPEIISLVDRRLDELDRLEQELNPFSLIGLNKNSILLVRRNFINDFHASFHKAIGGFFLFSPKRMFATFGFPLSLFY